MEIQLNDQYREIASPTTLLQLLESLHGSGPHHGIAIAVNQAVVPKNDWNHYLLRPQDAVLIIKATQGG